MSTIPDSKGCYRIPYASGTAITVTRDVRTHEPVGRVDLVARSGQDRPERHAVVAAAGGYVRYIEDGYSKSNNNGPLCKNNYVWIEHPNGEWTKYSHLAQHSVRSKAGLHVDQWVDMGTYLGDEHDVGCASGSHLHFEVGVPSDKPNPIALLGGHLRYNEDSIRNRNPRICGISNERFVDGNDHIASWQPSNLTPGLEEVVKHGLPVRYLQCFVEQLIDATYEPTWLQIFNSRGRAYANIVAHRKKSTFFLFHGLSESTYESKLEVLKLRKYHPTLVDTYIHHGEIQYTGIWKPMDDRKFYEYHGVQADEHQRLFDKLTRTGCIPLSISVVSFGQTRYWTAVYKKHIVGSFVVRSSVKVSDYEAFRNESAAKGRNITYLNSYNHRGISYMVAIATSHHSQGSCHRHGLTASTFQNEYDLQIAGGKLTRFVTGYGDCDRKYAATWS